MKFFNLLVCLCLLSNVTLAHLICRPDKVYDQKLKSVQINRIGSEMLDPTIRLQSSERLIVTFDDLSEEQRQFKYRIFPCNADWEIEDLPVSFYIIGADDGYIVNYRESFNTQTFYRNFSFKFPNENMSVKISGNYLIKIYDRYDYNEENLLCQLGFSVYEPLSAVKVEVQKYPISSYFECFQELGIELLYNSLSVVNPQTEVKVRIEQNSCRLSQYTPPVPVMNTINGVDYTQLGKNRYPVVGEYRSFDIRTLRSRTQRVRNIDFFNNQWRILIEDDKPYEQYVNLPDMNGKYVVQQYDYEGDSNSESDYANVYFTLRTNKPYEGTVYLFGELTNWSFENKYAMPYNELRGAYEFNLFLKQGLYNYTYVLVDKHGNIAWNVIDACSQESENQYSVYMYYRPTTALYDKLIGVGWAKSR